MHGHRAQRPRTERAWPLLSLLLCPGAPATTLQFTLSLAGTTSAGIYDSSGRLLRTLWRGQHLEAGRHVYVANDLDDDGRPIAQQVIEVRLLSDQVSYHWDGVIGNTSAAFTGAGVHHAMFPPTSIAIAGEHAVYAVGYNEGQPGTHGFALDRPQVDVLPTTHADAFSGWSLVATDGHRAYWANTGGLSHVSFVAVSGFGGRDFMPFAAGGDQCLNRAGPWCYPDQRYIGVVDVAGDTQSAPTGLAVQSDGNVLAVAHGRQGIIRLFDKASGAMLSSFNVPASTDAANQLAMAPNGDLWVISGTSVLRYATPASTPQLAASISGLQHPLAVAVHPGSNDLVLVADGGASQQVKAFDRDGRSLWTYGTLGGYGDDPSVSYARLWFRFDDSLERSGLAIQSDGSFWVIDTCNDRMLHVAADRLHVEQIAYIPASYSMTVDPTRPGRLFSNYLEFELRPAAQLVPGPDGGWRLVRNWLAGLPQEAHYPTARNGAFAGLQSVVTLAHDRTYAMSALPGGATALLELPESGAARFVRSFPAPRAGDSPFALYANGDLGVTRKIAGAQAIYRQSLLGLDASGDPIWDSLPHLLAAVPITAEAPSSGSPSARTPMTDSGEFVVFDTSVDSPRDQLHFHLGAVLLDGRDWLWKASPAGPIDQPGAFQTKAIDGTVNYGGNNVWAIGRDIIFGYHGEGFIDLRYGKVGEANQFIHFRDDGLYVGQFGVPTTRSQSIADAGVAGNSFSNILIGDGPQLLLYHNDESQHGGVHRWTIGNLDSIREIVGSGPLHGTIELN